MDKGIKQTFSLTESPVYLIYSFDWSVMKIHVSLNWSYAQDNFTCFDYLIWPEATVHHGPFLWQMLRLHYKRFIPNNAESLLFSS